MKPICGSRVLVWAALILFLVLIPPLIFFFPIVAAVIFVGCVTFVAIAVGRTEGFWKGLKLFIKEVLFGW